MISQIFQDLLIFFRQYSARYQRLDVLINNAGIFYRQEDNLETICISEFDSTFKTNLYGPIFLVQAALSLLKQSKGRIINVSSTLGAISKMGEGFTAYRLSKTALNAFTLHLAKTYSELISVAMHPGRIKTDMVNKESGGDPSEAAETAVWLAI